MRSRVTAATVAVASILLLTIGTAAAAGDAYRGWYGNLDLALSQPNSLDQHFANFIDFSSSTTRDHRLVMDNDADTTWRLDVGYGWGGKGSLQVSYWQFDNEDSQGGSLDGSVYPTIFGYGTNGGMYAYDATGVRYAAESSVKASTWDVDYVRPMKSGSMLTVRWLAGLRVASYEEDQSVEITDAATGYDCSTYACRQDKHFESDALGFRFGATAVFHLTTRLDLETAAAFSFMQADTTGDSSQTFVGVSRETNHGSDDNILARINDYRIAAVWNVGPADVVIGYQYADWRGLVADPVPGNEEGHFAAGPIGPRGRDSIAFGGWSAGVRWRFQRR